MGQIALAGNAGAGPAAGSDGRFPAALHEFTTLPQLPDLAEGLAAFRERRKPCF